MKVDSGAIHKIIDLIDHEASDIMSLARNRQLISLVMLLVYPPAPFSNTGVNPFSLAKDLVCCDNPNKAQQIVASILAIQSPRIASLIMERDILLEKLTSKPIPNSDFDQWILDIEHALNFWTGVSKDSKVKRQLQESNLPFKLYELLRDQQSSRIPDQRSILKSESGALIKIVDLIKYLVAGQSDLEEKLADYMI
jgi:hypothetical protein